jgi:hypothetical protein
MERPQQSYWGTAQVMLLDCCQCWSPKSHSILAIDQAIFRKNKNQFGFLILR